jgi:hypothetical protein
MLNKEESGKEKIRILILNWQRPKATKAIQKHSMNIDGREKNYQIDEAYLLLGSKIFTILFYSTRPYIQYPNSSNIYEAKFGEQKCQQQLNSVLTFLDYSKQKRH